MSERAPLSNVPTITLPADGKPVLIGRSSTAADHQISSNNPLISRVHVTAVYIAAAPMSGSRAKVEVTCLGWNGVKVHCGGEDWNLYKDDTFTSEKMLDVLLDIHDSRLLLLWPQLPPPPPSSAGESLTELDSSSDWLDSSPPRARGGPLYRGQLPESPVSPTLGAHDLTTSSNLVLGSDDDDDPDDDGGDDADLHPIVTVYEDDPSPSDHPAGTENDRHPESQSTQEVSQVTGTASPSDDLAEPEILSDHNEENDPLIVSFGPQGDNLLPRMASVSTAVSPPGTVRRGRATREARRRTAAPSVSAPAGPSLGRRPTRSVTPSPPAPPANQIALIQHLVNQLAYSRLSSTPITVIMSSLPAEVLTGDDATRDRTEPPCPDEIQSVLNTIACVGQVQREGKDAAGKPLETEYYYIPEHDEDETRKEMVVNSLRKPSLRACRKQHKVIRSPSDLGELISLLPSR